MTEKDIEQISRLVKQVVASPINNSQRCYIKVIDLMDSQRSLSKQEAAAQVLVEIENGEDEELKAVARLILR